MAMVSRRTLLAGAAGVLVGAPSAVTRPPSPASEYDAGAATAWFDMLLELVRRTPGYRPPVAARAIGSVQSAAAATVLTDLFGPVSFVDDTHADRGLPARSFGSFAEFADEAAISPAVRRHPLPLSHRRRPTAGQMHRTHRQRTAVARMTPAS